MFFGHGITPLQDFFMVIITQDGQNRYYYYKLTARLPLSSKAKWVKIKN